VGSQVHPSLPGTALRYPPRHPLRVALLELLSTRATLTSTQAARELGESSGACSFHLRQLERYGQVEPAPGGRGRERPWRLATGSPAPSSLARAAGTGAGDQFGELARELENEGYRRWLAGRETAPPGWRDEAFSAVLYLTPEQLTEVAAAIRAVVASFTQPDDPDQASGTTAPGRPAAVLPVGVVARMFPLLPPGDDLADSGNR
jgi:hypothetical protein